jgi:hypothetical protein
MSLLIRILRTSGQFCARLKSRHDLRSPLMLAIQPGCDNEVVLCLHTGAVGYLLRTGFVTWTTNIFQMTETRVHSPTRIIAGTRRILQIFLSF